MKNIAELLTMSRNHGKKWLQESKGLPQTAIEWAEDFATHLAYKPSRDERGVPDQLSTSQLRKFFGEIKKIQANGFQDNRTDFRMLKPQIAYAVGRDIETKSKKNKTKIKDFYDGIKHLIDDEVVHDDSTFRNFVWLMEAIVAYHKVAEVKRETFND